MTDDVIPELKSLLAEKLDVAPYNPDSNHPEKFSIDHLAATVRDWEIGSVDLSEMQDEFAKYDLGTFLNEWLQEQISEGRYTDPFNA